MSKWKVSGVDAHNSVEIESDGVSMDAHGNVIFVNVRGRATNEASEIVGILLQSGFVAKKEEY